MKPILIIDDDGDIRESLRDTLADEGYATAEACDGGEGLAYLRAHEVALVLLDWNMAPMDGETFMAELQEDDRINHLPVVLLSADARVTQRLRIGFVAMLGKPVDLAQLFALAERYCKQPAS